MSQFGEVRAACLVWPATRVARLPAQEDGGLGRTPQTLAANWLIAAVPDPGWDGAVGRRPDGRG